MIPECRYCGEALSDDGTCVFDCDRLGRNGYHVMLYEVLEGAERERERLWRIKYKDDAMRKRIKELGDSIRQAKAQLTAEGVWKRTTKRR